MFLYFAYVCVLFDYNLSELSAVVFFDTHIWPGTPTNPENRRIKCPRYIWLPNERGQLCVSIACAVNCDRYKLQNASYSKAQ